MRSTRRSERWAATECLLSCQRALTQKRTLWSWFERRAAYLSDCSVELPLRPSAIAAPPSGPSSLALRLRGVGSEVGAEPCQWALTQKRTLWGGGALQLLDLRLLEDGGECASALVSNVVGRNTASEGQDGNGERVGVSMGADTKANALGRRRTPVVGSASP